FDHFDPELVAEPARVGKERLLAAEGVQIRPTDPEAPNLHQRFALLGLPRMSGFADDKPAWLLKDYLFHGSLLRDDQRRRRPLGPGRWRFRFQPPPWPDSVMLFPHPAPLPSQWLSRLAATLGRPCAARPGRFPEDLSWPGQAQCHHALLASERL